MTSREARRTVACYVGLGSNLGDREANIRKALAMLVQESDLFIVSSLYETEPWGYRPQPRFLNAACGLKTNLPPLQLLRLLQRIEKAVGRKPTFPLGPRVIDLDILLYGRESFRTARLVIPHLGMAERAFVLLPLAEIAPRVRHPVLGLTIRQLLQSVSGKEEVRLLAPPPDIAADAVKGKLGPQVGG